MSRRDISPVKSRVGFSDVVQNAIYTPAAEFFKARYTRVALVVLYESRTRLVRVFPHELKF